MMARPGVLAATAVLLALTLHPALAAAAWLPAWRPLVAALTLLLLVGLVQRALSGTGGRGAPALAAGAALVTAAVAGDGLVGRSGRLSLLPGQGRGHFAETAPGGRPLGLRPLGFTVSLERARPEVALVFSDSGAPVELTNQRAVSRGGFRFGQPRATPTGQAARLLIAVADGENTETTEIGPDRPGRVGDLAIALEEYFPDFALDERQHPFTRSAEPRNPAALLSVERAGQAFRVFVLQALPGLHNVEGLGRSFALVRTDPELTVEITVAREPLAPIGLVGAWLVAIGAALLGRGR
jgi:hypothetical protein